MELVFNKETNGWVSEFEVTSDFNLHIEGVSEGYVRVYQKGVSSGEYTYVRNSSLDSTSLKVYDCDFSALVYPKYIKIVCLNEPTRGEITFNV